MPKHPEKWHCIGYSPGFTRQFCTECEDSLALWNPMGTTQLFSSGEIFLHTVCFYVYRPTAGPSPKHLELKEAAGDTGISFCWSNVSSWGFPSLPRSSKLSDVLLCPGPQLFLAPSTRAGEPQPSAPRFTGILSPFLLPAVCTALTLQLHHAGSFFYLSVSISLSRNKRRENKKTGTCSHLSPLKIIACVLQVQTSLSNKLCI